MTDDPYSRSPPNDLTAEQCTLGAMLIAPATIDTTTSIVAAADYHHPAHTIIHTAITTLATTSRPVDAVTIAAHLADIGQLTTVGGATYLHTLIEAVPVAASAGYYARIVADLAQRRRLIEAGIRITQLGHQPPGTTADAIDTAAQTIHNLTTGVGFADANPLAALLGEAIAAVEANAEGPAQGTPTGLVDLDRLTGGLHPGQLIVVAGRPGLGKSTAAMDFARAAAISHHQPAAVFSLEMSRVELVTRVLAAESRVPLHTLRTGQLSDDEWAKLARRMGEISEAPLFIDDTPNMTMLEIRAKARRVQQRHGLRLVVVDYLQLMTTPGRSESRQQEVSELSRGLKLLAKELGVAVVAVAQLNRGPEQRTDKRPLLSDLRDSGSIEQDADVVILLHRDDYYDKESPRAGEADFIVAKHRNGPTDTITVAAQLHLARFVGLAA